MLALSLYVVYLAINGEVGFVHHTKGRSTFPNRMNFRKSSERGSFSIQKFILQIFAIIDDTLVMNLGKKLQYNFPKMRGGLKAVWNFSDNSSDLEPFFVPN